MLAGTFEQASKGGSPFPNARQSVFGCQNDQRPSPTRGVVLLNFTLADLNVLFSPLNPSQVVQLSACEFDPLRHFSGACEPRIFCNLARTIRLQVVQQTMEFINQQGAVDAFHLRAHGRLGVGNGSFLNQAVRTASNCDIGKMTP